MAIDALTTTRAQDRIEPANLDGRPGGLSRRERRSRWLNRAVDVYVGFMFAMLGLVMIGIVLMLLSHCGDMDSSDTNGWGDKLLFGIIVVFGHPAFLAARLAYLVVGPKPTLGLWESGAPWDRAWNIAFTLALAPYIVALLFLAWRRYRTGGLSPAAVLPTPVAGAFLVVIQGVWVVQETVSAFAPFGAGG